MPQIITDAVPFDASLMEELSSLMDENFTPPNQVRQQAAYTNGHTNGHYAPGANVIWRNNDHDQPVVITGNMGQVDGEIYYSIQGSSTGIPASQIVEIQPEKSAHTDIVIGMIKTVADAAKDFDRDVRLKMLEPLAAWVGPIPQSERHTVRAALEPIFNNVNDLDDWMWKCPPDVSEPVFAPYSFDDLLNMPPKEWLTDQVIGRGDMGMVYGAPGCGKTFVVIDLALCACIGKRWAMRFDMDRALNVAYCAGEGISGLPARFKAAAYHHGIEELANFTFFKTIPQLYTDGDSITSVTITQFVQEWKQRTEAKAAQPLDLLILDTLHTASTAADENSAKDMGKVLHLCRWAANELGCAVLLVHHTNKNGSAERGSSSLRGAMDFMIEIKRISDDGTKAVMSCAKLKDGEQWRNQTLDLTAIDGLDSVRVWWDEPSDGERPQGKKAEDKAAILAEMKRYAGIRFPAKRLAEVIAKSENYCRNLLGELEKSKECSRELSEPTKKPSPRNSWVYFVGDLPAE
jgi:RecA-family ATPase